MWISSIDPAEIKVFSYSNACNDRILGFCSCLLSHQKSCVKVCQMIQIKAAYLPGSQVHLFSSLTQNEANEMD